LKSSKAPQIKNKKHILPSFVFIREHHTLHKSLPPSINSK